MIDFKKYEQNEISTKEAFEIRGGKVLFRYLRENNQYGLPGGKYFYNTETGGVWNILGTYEGSWCDFGISN